MHLIGLARLGNDAVVKFTPDGQAVVNLSLAFNYGKKNAAEGKRPTQWIDASLWGDRAQKLAPYLLKGTLIDVHLADPHLEHYTTRDGNQGTKIVAMVNHLEFASSPPSNGQQPAQQQGQQSQREQNLNRQHAASRQAAQGNDFNDDVPF